MENPILLDPVTMKEIYGISRRGQTYFGRVIYVGVIGLVLYEFWNSIAANTGSLSPSEYAQLSRTLFNTFVPLQMTMVSLASLAASADRIIREDRGGTLGLLLLTPLTARRIALSKWKAAMAQSGSLILCGAPVVAICVFLGGAGPWELLWCFSLTGAQATLGAAFGLRASAIYSTVPRALVMAFLYVIGYALLPLALLFVGGFHAIAAAPFINPIYSAGMLLYNKAGSDSVWSWSWIPATVLSVFAARFVVANTARQIERRVKVPATPTAPIEGDDYMPRTEIRPLLRKGDKAVRATREVWEADPLLWKELITRAGGRWSKESKSLFLIYAFIFVTLCWLFSRGNSLGTFAFLSAGFAVLAIVNGASLFAPEKEGRKMEMLLASPVSSLNIVRSKLLAGLTAPESLRVTVLAGLTALAFSWWSGPAGILLYFSVFFLFMIFVFVLSATASLHAATMQGASLASAGILCLILLVLPIVVSILMPSPGMSGSMPPLAYLLSSFNPVWILEPLDSARTAPTDAVGRFLLFSALYGTVTLGLVVLMFWRFDKVMGRV